MKMPIRERRVVARNGWSPVYAWQLFNAALGQHEGKATVFNAVTNERATPLDKVALLKRGGWREWPMGRNSAPDTDGFALNENLTDAAK